MIFSTKVWKAGRRRRTRFAALASERCRIARPFWFPHSFSTLWEFFSDNILPLSLLFFFSLHQKRIRCSTTSKNIQQTKQKFLFEFLIWDLSQSGGRWAVKWLKFEFFFGCFPFLTTKRYSKLFSSGRINYLTVPALTWSAWCGSSQDDFLTISWLKFQESWYHHQDLSFETQIQKTWISSYE